MNPAPAAGEPSGFPLLLLAVGGVALLLVLVLAKRVLLLVPLSPQYRRWLLRLGPALASIAVIAYLLLSARLHLMDAPRAQAWTLLGLMLVALGGGWLALTDTIAGLLVKVGGMCQTGTRIRLDELEGRVTSMGVRTLTLETANGEAAVIPYRKLLQHTLYVVPEAQGLVVHRFRVRVSPDVPMARLRQWLTETALSMHYCSVSRVPQLDYLAPGSYEVTVFALHPDYTSEVEFRLRERLREQLPRAAQQRVAPPEV